MDFDEIARQAEEMVAAGEQADTEAVQELARTLNITGACRVPSGARGQDQEARRYLGPGTPLPQLTVHTRRGTGNLQRSRFPNPFCTVLSTVM